MYIQSTILWCSRTRGCFKTVLYCKHWSYRRYILLCFVELQSWRRCAIIKIQLVQKWRSRVGSSYITFIETTLSFDKYFIRYTCVCVGWSCIFYAYLYQFLLCLNSSLLSSIQQIVVGFRKTMTTHYFGSSSELWYLSVSYLQYVTSTWQRCSSARLSSSPS